MHVPRETERRGFPSERSDDFALRESTASKMAEHALITTSRIPRVWSRDRDRRRSDIAGRCCGSGRQGGWAWSISMKGSMRSPGSGSVSPRGLAGLDPTVIPYAPAGFPFLVGLAYLGLGVSDLAAILVSIAGGNAHDPRGRWLARRTFGAGPGAAAALWPLFRALTSRSRGWR